MEIFTGIKIELEVPNLLKKGKLEKQLILWNNAIVKEIPRKQLYRFHECFSSSVKIAGFFFHIFWQKFREINFSLINYIDSLISRNMWVGKKTFLFFHTLWRSNCGHYKRLFSQNICKCFQGKKFFFQQKKWNTHSVEITGNYSHAFLAKISWK